MENESIKAQHEAIREHDKELKDKELSCSENVDLEQFLFFNTNASLAEIKKLREDIKAYNKEFHKLKITMEKELK